MAIDEKIFEIDYLVIDGVEKRTLEYSDVKNKKKITLDIVLKEEPLKKEINFDAIFEEEDNID